MAYGRGYRMSATKRAFLAGLRAGKKSSGRKYKRRW